MLPDPTTVIGTTGEGTADTGVLVGGDGAAGKAAQPANAAPHIQLQRLIRRPPAVDGGGGVEIAVAIAVEVEFRGAGGGGKVVVARAAVVAGALVVAGTVVVVEAETPLTGVVPETAGVVGTVTVPGGGGGGLATICCIICKCVLTACEFHITIIGTHTCM